VRGVGDVFLVNRISLFTWL